MKRAYSMTEVAGLLGLNDADAKALCALVFSGPRDLFSFQDLVMLRTAQGLAARKVAKAKIQEAIDRMGQRLPTSGAALSAVSVRTEGVELVVADGAERWNVVSGQQLFDFHRHPVPPTWLARGKRLDAEALFTQAEALEDTNPVEAIDGYQECLARDPRHFDAHVNLGRLLHTRKHLREAQAHYVAAVDCRPDDVTANFNLAVVLEDLGEMDAAIARYHLTLAHDPKCVDAYFNLSRLYEKKGQMTQAFRHLKDYRRLSK